MGDKAGGLRKVREEILYQVQAVDRDRFEYRVYFQVLSGRHNCTTNLDSA